MSSWLGFRKKRAMQGRLEGIYIASVAGAHLVSIKSAQSLQGQALKDDRYAYNQGFWKVIDTGQKTLISEFDLEQAKRRGLYKGFLPGSTVMMQRCIS